MPTDKIANYDSFSSNEKKVYQAIFARFNSVFLKNLVSLQKQKQRFTLADSFQMI